VDEKWLAEIESRDNLFPDVDWNYWKIKTPLPRKIKTRTPKLDLAKDRRAGFQSLVPANTGLESLANRSNHRSKLRRSGIWWGERLCESAHRQPRPSG
jgi:hypothetical protein